MWTLLTSPSPTKLPSWSCLCKHVWPSQVPKDTLCRRISKGLAKCPATPYTPLILIHPQHRWDEGHDCMGCSASFQEGNVLQGASTGLYHPKGKVHLLYAINTDWCWIQPSAFSEHQGESWASQPPRLWTGLEIAWNFHGFEILLPLHRLGSRAKLAEGQGCMLGISVQAYAQNQTSTLQQSQNCPSHTKADEFCCVAAGHCAANFKEDTGRGAGQRLGVHQLQCQIGRCKLRTQKCQ